MRLRKNVSENRADEPSDTDLNWFLWNPSGISEANVQTESFRPVNALTIIRDFKRNAIPTAKTV